jgi:hypothetical protein
MNVSAWSIRNPIPALLLFALLTLLGLMAFKGMGIQQFPDVDLPTGAVTASLPGAAPAQMENRGGAQDRELGRHAAGRQAHLHQGAGWPGDGHRRVPAREADAGSGRRRARRRFPHPLGPARRPQGPGDLADHSRRCADPDLYRRFQPHGRRSAVLVRRQRGHARRFSACAASGRSAASAVSAAKSASNSTRPACSHCGRRPPTFRASCAQVQQEAAGGPPTSAAPNSRCVRIATVQSAEELAALEIALSDGRRVRLSELATVSDTVAEQRSAALLDGQPVVGFEIVRARGAGEVAVAEGVRGARQTAGRASDISISEAFNFVDPVVDNFEGSMWLLIEGAILAVIVVWLFLRDWRATWSRRSPCRCRSSRPSPRCT